MTICGCVCADIAFNHCVCDLQPGRYIEGSRWQIVYESEWASVCLTDHFMDSKCRYFRDVYFTLKPFVVCPSMPTLGTLSWRPTTSLSLETLDPWTELAACLFETIQTCLALDFMEGKGIWSPF